MMGEARRRLCGQHGQRARMYHPESCTQLEKVNEAMKPR